MDSDYRTLVTAVHGEGLHGQDADAFHGVSIDSRAVTPGQLFICIQGDRFDGHDFLQQVLDKKVAGIVISDPKKLPDGALEKSGAFAVRVPDTLRALQDLASYHRNQQAVRVVGVTGTNGKSTTKEMISSIVSQQFQTLKTRGNLNNHIGLPLNVLDLEAGHQVAVLEMGMSGAGEIRLLSEIARPDVGVITNISEAHMIHLKTVREVQSAKAELYESLNEKGTAIVNADDPLVLELAKNLRARVITFGIEQPADVKATDIRHTKTEGYDFTLNLFGKQVPVHLPFLGHCNIYNALAAAATGWALGIPPETMNAGLNSVQAMGGRGEIQNHNGLILFNDTYNANPESMREGLETLKRFPVEGRRFVVIGDMLELGAQEKSAHQKLGETVAAHGFNFLVTVGPLARIAGEAALQSGMAPYQVACMNTHAEAVDFLKETTSEGDCLLFKGSRGTSMEKVLEGLKQ